MKTASVTVTAARFTRPTLSGGRPWMSHRSIVPCSPRRAHRQSKRRREETFPAPLLPCDDHVLLIAAAAGSGCWDGPEAPVTSPVRPRHVHPTFRILRPGFVGQRPGLHRLADIFRVRHCSMASPVRSRRKNPTSRSQPLRYSPGPRPPFRSPIRPPLQQQSRLPVRSMRFYLSFPCPPLQFVGWMTACRYRFTGNEMVGPGGELRAGIIFRIRRRMQRHSNVTGFMN